MRPSTWIANLRRHLDRDVVECLAESGAEIIISLNASPFELGKTDQRMMHAVTRVHESRLLFIYVNMTGGQDELVYDGGSFALAGDGSLACQPPSFSESVVVVQLEDSFGTLSLTGQVSPPDEGMEALYRGLTLGLRDYVNKNGFQALCWGCLAGLILP